MLILPHVIVFWYWIIFFRITGSTVGGVDMVNRG
jgi:hypothetical protein